MSNPASAFLGYGYAINKYEDCPMPSHLEDYGRNPEWEEWADKFVESNFYYPIETYDNEICFYGVRLSNIVDAGEYEEFGSKLPYFSNAEKWDNFTKEFKEFFPKGLNKEPQFILVNTFWF